MKKIYLIAFRGTGFRDEKFVGEDTLVRAGHVGFSFEGDETSILGFHPTPKAVEDVGGEEAAILWLREKKTLDGTLQEDYRVFTRAAVTPDARLMVTSTCADRPSSTSAVTWGVSVIGSNPIPNAPNCGEKRGQCC